VAPAHVGDRLDTAELVRERLDPGIPQRRKLAPPDGEQI
jgi:hypothetical protein